MINKDFVRGHRGYYISAFELSICSQFPYGSDGPSLPIAAAQLDAIGLFPAAAGD
jgi:hypothetical protein